MEKMAARFYLSLLGEWIVMCEEGDEGAIFAFERYACEQVETYPLY